MARLIPLIALILLVAWWTGRDDPSQPARSGERAAAAEMPAYEADRHVRQSTLVNGLQVLTWPRPGCGWAKVQLWVGTGSNHEEEFTGMGLSHFLEHAMFDGSEPLIRDGVEMRRGWGNDEIGQRIKDLGGYSNAYTNKENTVYIHEVLAEDIPESIALMEAEVMRPTLNEAILTGPKGEVRAVVNELRRRRENPMIELRHHAARDLYGPRAYGNPIIGYEQPIQQVTSKDLRAYYDRRYVPDNMALVVVGDVDHQQIVEAARQAWVGDNPEQPLHPRRPFEVVKTAPWALLTAEREFVHESARMSRTMSWIQFMAVPWDHPDAAAGIVLDMMLSSPTGSGLFQRDIKDQDPACLSIGTSPNFEDEAGQFTIYLTTATPEDSRRLRDRCQEILDRIAGGDLPEGAVARSRKIIHNGMLREWENLDGVAHILGKGAVSRGGPGWHRHMYEAVSRVTPEQVVRFARTYLGRDQRCSSLLVPEGTVGSETSGDREGGLQEPVSRVLADNVDVAVQRDDSVPFFAMTVAVRGGLMAETVETNGTGALIGHLLGQATTRRSKQDLQDVLDEHGITLGTTSGSNSLLLSVSGPRDSFSTALELAGEVLFEARFATEEFGPERDRVVSQLTQARLNPESEVDRQTRQALFAGHPYALDPAGDPAVVGALTPENLADHLRSLLGGYLSVSVAGDVPLDDPALDETLRQVLVRGSHAARDLSTGPALTPVAAFRSLDIPFTTQQTYIQWRLPGPAREEDEAVRRVVGRVLAQRISEAVRNRDGLSYASGAYMTGGYGPGSIVLYADTKSHDKLDRVRHNFREEMENLRDDLLPADKLAATARAIAFGEARSSETLQGLAQSLALRQLYGEPLDKSRRLIEELTSLSPEQVRIFCRTWLREDRAIEAVVRDAGRETAK